MISVLRRREKGFERQYPAGELELEFTPQGTLAERMLPPAAPASGFFTKTGVGTLVAEGKEHREFDGETHVMERGIVPRRRAGQGRRRTRSGNLSLPQDRAQLQPGGGDLRQVCMVEVERVVACGAIDPDDPPAGHLRAPHRAQPDPGKAHREAHHPRSRTLGRTSEFCPWPMM